MACGWLRVVGRCFMYPLNTSIEKLTRVGKTTASRLKKLGIDNVYDLIFYFPFRYEDYSQLINIADLKPDQIVTVKGQVMLINNRQARTRRMTITECLLEDETGSVKIIWFNQPFLIKNIKAGDNIIISGKTELDKMNLIFKSPAYEKSSLSGLNTGKIVPVYASTSNITQKQIRFLTGQAIKAVKQIIDWLPEKIRKQNKLIKLDKALKNIHFPKDFKTLKQAQLRLKFDELFLIQMQSQLMKKFLAKNKAAKIKFKQNKIKKFVDSLPFELTADQKKASWQILQDLEKEKPMNRLLEGDVGSGKTVVASIAILNTVLNKYQAVLMAPTEILAKQHYIGLCKLFKAFNLKIALFTRSERLISGIEENISKKQLIEHIKKGEADLIIGTHALIQGDVKFKKLGLVIIDEQHRFGVEQRKAIKEKNKSKKLSHFLSMTATPIPRSLALILYGDLDLSIIKQMPKGRKKIITKLVAEQNRTQAYQFIRQQIDQSRQVFVICPLIDPSDKLGVKSVTQEFKKLDKDVFPDLKIGLLHGKLKADEKEQIMKDFKDNKIKILVSTSVIEVGIDIPNATIMMIEGADRFGLAQLHQFRGRVGRGEYQSYCFLFTENHVPKTIERLNALVNSNDGFALAEHDLKFRGPGEVYGTRQSGLPDLKIAKLTDLELINLTKKIAQEFFEQNNLVDFPLLKAKLENMKVTNHLE